MFFKKAFLLLSVSFKLFLSLNSEEDEQRRRQEKLRKEEDLQEFFIFLWTTTTFGTFFFKMIRNRNKARLEKDTNT
jgi:hypothetical protein